MIITVMEVAVFIDLHILVHEFTGICLTVYASIMYTDSTGVQNHNNKTPIYIPQYI